MRTFLLLILLWLSTDAISQKNNRVDQKSLTTVYNSNFNADDKQWEGVQSFSTGNVSNGKLTFEKGTRPYRELIPAVDATKPFFVSYKIKIESESDFITIDLTGTTWSYSTSIWFKSLSLSKRHSQFGSSEDIDNVKSNIDENVEYKIDLEQSSDKKIRYYINDQLIGNFKNAEADVFTISMSGLHLSGKIEFDDVVMKGTKKTKK